MSLRQKIRITLGMFAVSAVMMAAGIWMESVAVSGAGGFGWAVSA